MKSLVCTFQGGVSYRKYKYWWVKSGWGKYKAKYGQCWEGKNRQLGTQLSSQFICVAHPTVCDINRISNLAMNYFYVVNLCSHFPYVSIAASNNSLFIFKMFPINTTWIRGSPKNFSSISLFIFYHIIHPIYLH